MQWGKNKNYLASCKWLLEADGSCWHWPKDGQWPISFPSDPTITSINLLVTVLVLHFRFLLPISYYLVSVSRQTWKTTGKSVNLLSLKAKEVFGPGATLQLISPSECSEPLLGFTGKLLFSWQPVAISCPLSWKNLNNVRMTSHEKPLKIFENACSLNSANTLVASHTE